MIAGGAGYVGSVLVPKLIEREHEVHVVDLCWFGCQLPEKAVVHREDIWSLTEQDLEGFDRVIFLAGLSNDPMAELSPALNFRENAAQPAYLAYIAKRAGVPRMVYASSCSVYGYTENETYDEESPTVCDYPYGISKLQMGRYCAYRPGRGLWRFLAAGPLRNKCDNWGIHGRIRPFQSIYSRGQVADS